MSDPDDNSRKYYSRETLAAYGAVIDAAFPDDAEALAESLKELFKHVHCDVAGEVRAAHVLPMLMPWTRYASQCPTAMGRFVVVAGGDYELEEFNPDYEGDRMRWDELGVTHYLRLDGPKGESDEK